MEQRRRAPGGEQRRREVYTTRYRGSRRSGARRTASGRNAAKAAGPSRPRSAPRSRSRVRKAGSIRTDRLAGRIRALGRQRGLDDTAAAQALAAETGVARFGEPEEIAVAVAFLASRHAAYLQGAILDVDGGWNRAL